MDKTRELLHLQRFKEVCSLFPDGEIENNREKPDFTVHAQNKVIGIEHTEVFQPGPSHGESLQAQDNLALRIVEKAKNLYAESHGPPLFVQIRFNPRVKINKQSVSVIAEKVAGLIEETHILADYPVTLKRTQANLHSFPKEVVHIYIYQRPDDKVNQWHCSSGGSIPEITKEHLQETINKKDQKLDSYTSCSETWLLIVADDARHPTTVDLARTAVTHNYETKFDRVFFFWHASRRYIELQLEHRSSKRKNELIETWKREEQQPFTAWDFSYLDHRMVEDEPPWSYLTRAAELMRHASSVIDLDTGGGEHFLSLRDHWPPKVVATENYPPNFQLATERLAPFGVTVKQIRLTDYDPMPFEDGEFDLVLNRHAAFNPAEVARILAPGGTFLTQQVHGLSTIDLLTAFDAKPQWPDATLEKYVPRLQAVGLIIRSAEEWSGRLSFTDVGAIVYYLKAVPWLVPGFSVATHLAHLTKLQRQIDRGEPLDFVARKYLIEAWKG